MQAIKLAREFGLPQEQVMDLLNQFG
jgi:hypothetical protein